MVDVYFFVENFAGDENTRAANQSSIEVEVGLAKEKQISLHQGHRHSFVAQVELATCFYDEKRVGHP